MRKSILIILFLVCTKSIQAQFFVAGGHLNGGIPISKLEQEVGKLVFPTISGIVMYEFADQPFQVGLEVGYGIYGTKVETRNDLYPGFSDEYRIRRNNNFTSGMAVFRFLPSPASKFNPFIEMQMGANYLYSKFRIRPAFFDEAVEVGKDMDDWAFGYKIGGGIQWPIPWIEGGKLDLRLTYQSGGNMKFLTKDDTNYLPDKGDGEFEYNPRYSPLQLITASVGIIIYDAF